MTDLRGDATHDRLRPLLAAGSWRWATSASLLVVNICYRYVEDTDWESVERELGLPQEDLVWPPVPRMPIWAAPPPADIVSLRV